METVACRRLGELLDLVHRQHEWLVSLVIVLVDQRAVDTDKVTVALLLVCLHFLFERFKLSLIALQRAHQVV